MALLAPDPHRIGRPPGGPEDDRAPDSLAAGTPEPLRSELVTLLGEDRVMSRPIDLIRYASDASPYRLLPSVVVMARNAGDIAKLFDYAQRNDRRITFRGGGTSLNGQGQTDDILVDVRKWWSGVEVEGGGARARVKPGTVLGFANRVLARHGYRLGPDPASTDIATVGGVVNNNSGGMRCGVTWDSYSTVEAMKLVLPSGAVIDTEAPDAEQRFAAAEPKLAAGLVDLRDELRADDELTARIRKKFQIKNTMGYRLCALLDADTPLEMFRRLVIGSEGTLAFVSEVVFKTRPEPALTTIAWIHFDSIDSAVAPVPELVAAGARATELMIAPALMAAAHNIPGLPERWKQLPLDSAALLVEFGATDEGELDARIAKAADVLNDHELLYDDHEFAREREQVELAWRVREGLFGLVGQIRPPGTALIIEDVCVEPARLAECALDIQGLLGEHGFLVGVAGHVSAGNLHFQLTPDFAEAADRERYGAFMRKLVDLIVDKYDGSLKAEHGTGINMAPYVEREWGEKATRMMWKVKQLADPHGLLNPGVVLNRDPTAHMRNLKSQPPIEEVVVGCVECGFCEPVCPSRNTTTTPRQRIVVRREMARQPAGSPVYEALLADYQHDAIDTCAADGSCAPVCPLAIDTGAMVKQFRALERSPREEGLGLKAARRYATVEKVARAGLRIGGVGGRTLPGWPDGMPAPAPAKLPATARAGAAAVYLPACINRIFGSGGVATLPQALVTVSERAGLPLWIPDDVAGHCCAAPWNSKGYRRGGEFMEAKTAKALKRWSDGGALPIVIDASSCAQELIENVEAVEVLDSIAWVHDRLLSKLQVGRKLGSVAVHPTCSANQLGLAGKLREVASTIADEVVVPAASGCCGMAGDRGLRHPELPQSALRDVASELEERQLDACVSSNRTCEIGLQQVTGRPYESFVFALEELTR